MADDGDTRMSMTDSDVLYDQCSKTALDSEEQFRKTFNQEDLLSHCKDAGLYKVFDLKTLMPLVQTLSYSNLFISLKGKGGTLCWSLRSRDAAEQMKKLTSEERMVYVMIEEAQSNGAWIRNIKKRCNLTDPGANKVVDRLIKLKLVKSIKNIRAPAQKTLMLIDLVPSEDVTGGSFYDSGELEENLVEELGNLITFHVRQAGWVEEKRRKPKSDPTEIPATFENEQTRDASPEETRGRKKRKASHTHDIEDGGPAKKARRHEHSHYHVQLSREPGHSYPSTAQIHEYITNNNFISASKAASLTVDEVQNIINMLVWDGKLEPVNDGYRAIRGVKQSTIPSQDKEDDPMGTKYLTEDERKGNGLTEMPCGRCPVREICGTGGPVNAGTCVYFEDWLKMAVEGPQKRGRGAVVEIMG